MNLLTFFQHKWTILLSRCSTYFCFVFSVLDTQMVSKWYRMVVLICNSLVTSKKYWVVFLCVLIWLFIYLFSWEMSVNLMSILSMDCLLLIKLFFLHSRDKQVFCLIYVSCLCVVLSFLLWWSPIFNCFILYFNLLRP